jgi:predicted nucleic acid-binding protein
VISNPVVLDTDIVIDLLKTKQPVIDRYLRLLESGVTPLLSPIVVAEVYAGTFEREHKMIENLFDHCHTVNVDRAIATQAGRYAKQFRKSFNGISLEDFLLAATARVHRCPLWTRNRKHFPMPDIEFIGEAGHSVGH